MGNRSKKMDILLNMEINPRFLSTKSVRDCTEGVSSLLNSHCHSIPEYLVEYGSCSVADKLGHQ